LSYNPKHVPPAELEGALGARTSGGRTTVDWVVGGVARSVEVRRNDPANLLLLSGDDAAVDGLQELLKSFDQAPRQIALEARIVEVDTDRARDLGIDWSQLSLAVNGQQNAERDHLSRKENSPSGSSTNAQELAQGRVLVDTRLTLQNALHL